MTDGAGFIASDLATMMMEKLHGARHLCPESSSGGGGGSSSTGEEEVMMDMGVVGTLVGKPPPPAVFQVNNIRGKGRGGGIGRTHK